MSRALQIISAHIKLFSICPSGLTRVCCDRDTAHIQPRQVVLRWYKRSCWCQLNVGSLPRCLQDLTFYQKNCLFGLFNPVQSTRVSWPWLPLAGFNREESEFCIRCNIQIYPKLSPTRIFSIDLAEREGKRGPVKETKRAKLVHFIRNGTLFITIRVYNKIFEPLYKQRSFTEASMTQQLGNERTLQLQMVKLDSNTRGNPLGCTDSIHRTSTTGSKRID